MLILDYFSLKYEGMKRGGGGGGQTDPLPQKKTTLKKPGLIRDEAYSAVIRGGSHSWLENR